MNKKEIARRTLQILEQEKYKTPQGYTVDISKQLLQYCLEQTECYTPEQPAARHSAVWTHL
jgi:hypothetical protein